MSVPPLVSPSDAFLSQDPHAAFLASGDPQQFLRDNLPSVTQAAEDGEDKDSLILPLAIGIAAAFLGWRALAARRLRELPPPTPRDELGGRLASLTGNEWMALAVPVLREAFTGDVAMSPQLAEAAAATYAARLGQYVHETSADALVRGYTAELARGVHPELAWGRATMGFGLSNRAMRSWMAAQRNAPAVDDVLSVSAKRALDKALLQRADALGMAEAWQARQVGRSIVWMEQLRAGQLPPGARKRWLTERDELVCGVCGPLHEVEVGINERFRLPNGASLWAPGVHPNCRCDLELVTPTTLDGVEKIAKVISSDSQRRLARHAASGKLMTPTGRKQAAVEVAVDELAARRRARKLRRMDPQHPAVQAALAKARGQDPYDRDASGRFAEHESRAAGARRGAPAERESHTIATMERAQAQTQPVTAEQTEVDIFAEPGTPEAQTFIDATVDAVSQVDATTAPVDVLAEVDATAEAVDALATPQVGTGSGQLIIFINGKPEPMEPDKLVLAPVDWYLTVVNSGIERAEWRNDHGSVYRQHHSPAEWDRQQMSAAFGRTDIGRRPDGKPYTEDDLTPEDYLPDVITSDDIGKIVDFDAWQARNRLRERDPDLPGFPARQLDGPDEMLDMIVEGVPDLSELAEEETEEYQQYRSDAMDAYWQSARMDVPALGDDEVAHILREAGMSEEARDYSPQWQRERVLQALTEMFESADDEALADAYLEYMLDHDDEVEALEASLGVKYGSGEDFSVVPQLFSFRTGSFTADRMAGARNALLLHGKYRIAAVKTHSLTRELGSRSSGGQMRTSPVANHPNPRVGKWREIVLEQVD